MFWRRKMVDSRDCNNFLILFLGEMKLKSQVELLLFID